MQVQYEIKKYVLYQWRDLKTFRQSTSQQDNRTSRTCLRAQFELKISCYTYVRNVMVTTLGTF